MIAERDSFAAVVKRIPPKQTLKRDEYEAFLTTLYHDNNNSRFGQLGPAVVRRILKCLILLEIRGNVMEFFIGQRGKLWHKLRNKIDDSYPVHVQRATGSKLPAIVGLSRKTALPRDVFRAWTGRLSPHETIVVEDNADMSYGRKHENRVRRIVCIVFCHFDEPGFFIHVHHRHYGVSPDGVTRGRIFAVVTRSTADMLGLKPENCVASVANTTRVTVCLGVMVLEIKCSRYGLKEYMQIEHIVQMHLEMWLADSRFSILAYWHQDQMRMWLVEFCESLWQWIDRRVGAFILACKNNLQVLPEELATCIAWELQDEWFPNKYSQNPWGKSKEKRKWAPPQRPRTWLLFQDEKSRSTERTEETMESGARVCPVEKPDNDPWFTEAWHPLQDEQASGSKHELRIFGIHVAP